MGIFDQAEYAVRCEWGQAGVAALAPISDVVIIVDVLSFSTCVEIAVGRGGAVLPFPRKDESARAFAEAQGAQLASPERSLQAQTHPGDLPKYSLSPTSLLTLTPGTRLVLPSPNGATLSGLTGSVPTFAGCLRNARAVAEAAQSVGARIAVIAAGERWPEGTLRPAIEYWLGAGAILHHLRGLNSGTFSPEAALAAAAFLHAHDADAPAGLLPSWIEGASSGKELIAEGFGADVQLACAVNVSQATPRLHAGAYIAG